MSDSEESDGAERGQKKQRRGVTMRYTKLLLKDLRISWTILLPYTTRHSTIPYSTVPCNVYNIRQIHNPHDMPNLFFPRDIDRVCRCVHIQYDYIWDRRRWQLSKHMISCFHTTHQRCFADFQGCQSSRWTLMLPAAPLQLPDPKLCTSRQNEAEACATLGNIIIMIYLYIYICV